MSDHNENGGTAVQTAPPKVKRLPQWNVLLHNDDDSEMLWVVQTILELTPLERQEAVERMLEAHETGVSLLFTTHQEHAELVEEQFATKLLTVTIEPEI